MQSKEDKRKHIINEVIETERAYVSFLSLLVQVRPHHSLVSPFVLCFRFRSFIIIINFQSLGADFDATPEELGGGLDPKNENGVARQQRREKGRERRKDKADRGGGGSGSGSDAGGGDKKRKRHHHHHHSSSSSTPSGGYASPGNAGTPGVSGSSASAAAAAQQRKERKRVKEERDETYSQGGGRRNESSGYAPPSFEHIEFGHS